MLVSRTQSRKLVSLEQLAQYLATCDAIQDFDRLWIAYSGGVDSTVLLHAAARAFGTERLAAVHINHGLSSNADAWQSHCERTCTNLGLKSIVRSVEISGANVEESGRKARLDAFADLLDDHDVVATAHHRDDELESLMWQRETGRAMIGIPRLRALDHGRLWRPLLSFQRCDLERIAQDAGLAWVEDESNDDVSFTRNRLRHEVLPRLRREDRHFDERLYASKEPELEHVPRESLAISSRTACPSVIRAWLYAYNIVPRDRVVQQISQQAHVRNDAQVCVRVSPRRVVRRFQNRLYVVPDSFDRVEKSVRVGDNVRLQFGELRWKQAESGLPIGERLEIRQRTGGESIQSLEGQTVRLARWFYDERIPVWERDAWPLLHQGDALVGVPGLSVAFESGEPGGWVPTWQRIDPLADTVRSIFTDT